MPGDPFIVAQEVDTSGQHDIINVQKYEQPYGTDGEPLVDEFAGFDMDCAKTVKRLLDKAYPDHLWAVISDVRQGIVKFNIPTLMGLNNWWLINLRTTQMTPQAILLGGGEILERYGLRRGRMEIGSFLNARAKHSALVVPGRPVPE